MKLHGHAISVPKFGQLPNPTDRKHLSACEIVSLAPLVNPFLRPEEQHCRSGEDQIIIPAREGKGEMDQHVAQAAVFGGEDAALSDLTISNFQLNRPIAFSEHRINGRITMQRCRDAEHVPGTVREIGFPIRMDFEIRGNRGERVCHADRQSLGFEEEGVTVV